MAFLKSLATPGWIVLPVMTLFMLAAGCGSNESAQPLATEDVPVTSKRAAIPGGGGSGGPSGGSYSGPGDTVPGAAGSGGGCSSPPSCGTFTIPNNQISPDWNMNPSNYRTGIWPPLGQLVGYALVDYYFTVADYNALVAQQPVPNADGNYTIVAGQEHNTQNMWFVDYANFGAHAMAYDGTHQTIETVCKGDFGTIYHQYDSPPGCTYGNGAISFSKSCMDNLLSSVSVQPTDILYVISFLYCTTDF